MQAPRLRSIGISLVIIGLFVTAVQLLLEGMSHYAAWTNFALAEDNLHQGQYVDAASWFVKGMMMSVEGGIRFRVAIPYQERTRALAREGKLAEAVKACWTTEEVLGSYDDEGVNAYWCFVIEECIENPSLPTCQVISNSAE